MSVFEAADGPGEVLSKVKEYGSTGRSSLILDEGESAIGKLRLVGVYDDRQEGHFMLRIRVPGGRLNWRQAEVIGEAAEQFAIRPDWERSTPQQFLEITTRQDIQLHWIRLDHLPEIWARLEEVGVTSLQACGDTTRNITSCPVAGLDPHEVMDVSPLVQQMNRYVLEHPEYGAFLPRKFKIAITGCRDDCILARINDLAFVPARRDAEVGFNIYGGGGLSDYPRLASDLDLFVTPEEVVSALKASVQVYKDFGDYENKAVNRFRRVVEELGIEATRREVAERLPFAARSAGEELSQGSRHDHVGVHAQRQPGQSYVGLAVPVGRMRGQEMIEAARLAHTYGDGGVRLTQRQNLVITGVANERAEALVEEPLLQKFTPRPATFARSVVACTSSPFCKFGILPAKELGLRLSSSLDQAFAGNDLGSLKLHVSGCKASCAQVQIADVGLRATLTKDEDSLYEAVDVSMGGSLGDGRLAEWVALEVPVPKVQQGLHELLTVYQDQRADSETFGQYVRRLDQATLRSYFQEV